MVLTNALPFPLKLVGIQEAHEHIDGKEIYIFGNNLGGI